MTVVPYTPEYEWELVSWLQVRGLPQTLVSQLPKIGFISPGVGAAFLRQCEGGFGMVDSMITNPDADPATRNSVLESITQKLVKAAQDRKITVLIAFTTDEHTHERALRNGFKALKHSIIAINPMQVMT